MVHLKFNPVVYCAEAVGTQSTQWRLLLAAICCSLSAFLFLQVRYLAEHLASLLLLPEVRQGMCRLPAPVLQELLSAEVLEVEQVQRGS